MSDLSNKHILIAINCYIMLIRIPVSARSRSLFYRVYNFSISIIGGNFLFDHGMLYFAPFLPDFDEKKKKEKGNRFYFHF